MSKKSTKFRTLTNIASHGMWRAKHDIPDMAPAFLRLSAFTARAVKVELGRRIMAAKPDRFIAHSAIHTTGNNIGDMALPLTIRKVFDYQLGKQNWYLQPLWREINSANIDFFNDRAKLMLVGGGGLLLPDDKLSGWQWNISYNTLKRLNIPLCIFAVGYNRFRGQLEFNSKFKDHIELTAEKSAFIGLRNSPSAERLAEYLSPSAQKKLRLQPCITTVLNRYYPSYKPQLRQPYTKEIAINAAFDRAELRFGLDPNATEIQMAKLVQVARWAHKNGWKIHLMYHAFEDAAFANYVKRAGVPFKHHWLPRMSPEDVFDLYTRIPIVLGMRGHAQMIPYGLGNMIFPVVTHDKLVYFLKEIGKPHWGTELKAASAADDLIEKIRQFDRNRDSYFSEIEKSKDRLWAVCKKNIDELDKLFQLR
ncbi:MAG: polysaccharide pyruvyl transferase family protein [Solimonas sp.]